MRQVAIALGLRDRGMAENIPDFVERDAGHDQPRRAGVPHVVRAKILNAGPATGSRKALLEVLHPAKQ